MSALPCLLTKDPHPLLPPPQPPPYARKLESDTAGLPSVLDLAQRRQPMEEEDGPSLTIQIPLVHCKYMHDPSREGSLGTFQHSQQKTY